MSGEQVGGVQVGQAGVVLGQFQAAGAKLHEDAPVAALTGSPGAFDCRGQVRRYDAEKRLPLFTPAQHDGCARCLLGGLVELPEQRFVDQRRVARKHQ